MTHLWVLWWSLFFNKCGLLAHEINAFDTTCRNGEDKYKHEAVVAINNRNLSKNKRQRKKGCCFWRKHMYFVFLGYQKKLDDLRFLGILLL